MQKDEIKYMCIFVLLISLVLAANDVLITIFGPKNPSLIYLVTEEENPTHFLTFVDEKDAEDTRKVMSHHKKCMVVPVVLQSKQ